MVQTNISILDYILQRSGAKPKRQGDKILIDPCPICGHRDHFYVYPQSNSYSSFSGCCKGGSIIDALMEFERLSLAEAMARVHGDREINPFDAMERERDPAKDIETGLKNWRNKTFDRLCIIYRATQEAKRTLKPDQRGYIAACEFENILDYWTDMLASENERSWLQVFRELGEGWGY